MRNWKPSKVQKNLKLKNVLLSVIIPYGAAHISQCGYSIQFYFVQETFIEYPLCEALSWVCWEILRAYYELDAWNFSYTTIPSSRYYPYLTIGKCRPRENK